MTPDLLRQLAKQKYNRVALTREWLADFETPISVYLKLANTPYSYLFESAEGGKVWGRYSIIGLGCREIMKVYGHEVLYEKQGKIVQRKVVENPLKELEHWMKQFKVMEIEDDNMPRFCGGFVGYLGYDVMRYTEKRLRHSTPKNDRLNVPDMLLMLSDNFIVFDNFFKKTTFFTFINPAEPDAYQEANDRFRRWFHRLRSAKSASLEKMLRVVKPSMESPHLYSSIEREQYETEIKKIKNYIKAGDVMQVVLSRQIRTPCHEAPINVYRALRALNPSPYMYFMNMKQFHIVGSSPEILVRLEKGIVTIRPLAGTRKRGMTPEEDRQLEWDLLNDAKEVAEHLMLIDLGRNDIGRVSKTGSVVVTEKMMIERYSHVMHISSNVNGTLNPGVGMADVIAATLPAGTLSGAPKIRAMEIIDEIEPVKRGIYGGSIGYLGWNGNMDMAIALRTAVIKDGQLYNQAGGGIVYDSNAALEWGETVNKSGAIFDALAMVCRGRLEV